MSAADESGGRTASRLVLAAVMLGAGLLHFAAPRVYEPLVPDALGAPRAWVLGSGAAQVAAGGLLAVPRTRRVGALATFAVLLGVWPANWHSALQGGLPVDGLLGSATVAWVRVPLQLPLLAWAWSHRRVPQGRGHGHEA